MSDINEALAQLERRLSDLKHELVRIAEEPYDPPGREPGREGVRQAAREPGREPAQAAWPPPPAEPHRPAEPHPPPPAPGEQRYAPPGERISSVAHEVVGRVEADAARLLVDAYQRVDELKHQIEQLLGIRESLLRSARELLNSYDHQLSQLEAAFGQPPPAAPGGPGSPGAPAPYRRAAAPLHQPTIFAEAVAVIVRAVNRVQTIQVLEDSLSRVPGVQSAYVRGYHEGEVRLELTLQEAVDLLEEFKRALPYEFAVESARPDQIVLRLEHGAAGGEGERIRQQWMHLQERPRG